ncbi:hypothetical protein BN381_330017 [Candidatus Microthrix parvicella RN1]|uniref:Uncharacterized protein n=1 Tax=Candidatus Neomicrothrix parvicella RN1 TaxID=1229780 RepID=R4Z5W3_9ACTN|nr:hypothetical protein BN381_330017 [Candidatus Microthrix parvicella RN1]
MPLVQGHDRDHRARDQRQEGEPKEADPYPFVQFLRTSAIRFIHSIRSEIPCDGRPKLV